jgi:hypothetical protein
VPLAWDGLAADIRDAAQRRGIAPTALPKLTALIAAALSHGCDGMASKPEYWTYVAANRVTAWLSDDIDANAVSRAAEGVSQNLAHGDVPERDAHQKGLRIDPEACCDDQEPRGGNGP